MCDVAGLGWRKNHLRDGRRLQVGMEMPTLLEWGYPNSRSRTPSSAMSTHIRTPHTPGRISPPLPPWPICTLSAGQQGTNEAHSCGRVRRSAWLAPHASLPTPRLASPHTSQRKMKKGAEWGVEGGGPEADVGSREVGMPWHSPGLAGSRRHCCFFLARVQEKGGRVLRRKGVGWLGWSRTGSRAFFPPSRRLEG